MNSKLLGGKTLNHSSIYVSQPDPSRSPIPEPSKSGVYDYKDYKKDRSPKIVQY